MNPEDEFSPIGLGVEDSWAEWEEQRRMDQLRQTVGEEEEEATEDRPDTGLLISTARAVGRAANELSNTTVSIGKEIVKRTGLYKLMNDEEGEEQWLEWYEQRTSSVNPLQFDVAENPGGVWGFYEGVAQFAAPFGAVSRVLKGASTALAARHILRGAVAGGVVDFAALDPWDDRLANLLIDKGPATFRNDLTEFLAAQEDDPELFGRLKNSLEGLFVGGTIDALGAVLKAQKAVRLARENKITQQEAAERITRAADEIVDRPDEAFATTLDGDGRAAITVKDDWRGVVEEEIGESLPPRLEFDNPAEAEVVAAGMNEAMRDVARDLPPAIDDTGRLVLSDDQLKHLKDTISATVSRIASGSTGNLDMRRLMEGINLNLNMSDSSFETRAVINALSTVIGDVIHETTGNVRSLEDAFGSNYVRGSGQSNTLTQTLADGLVDNATPDEIISHIQTTYGATKNVAETLLAARMLLHTQAARAFRLTRALEVDPTNPVIVSAWAKSADRVARLAVPIAGTKANLGRGLQSLQIKVDDTRVIATDVLGRESVEGSVGSAGARRGAEAGARGGAEAGAREGAEAGARGGAEAGAARSSKQAKPAEPKDPTVETQGLAWANDAKDALKRLRALRKAHPNIGKGTNTLGAREFQLARARRRAQSIMRRAEFDPEKLGEVPPSILNEAEYLQARRIWEEARKQVDDPLQATAGQIEAAARVQGGRNQVDNISKVLDQEEAFLERIVRGEVKPKARTEDPFRDVLTPNPITDLVKRSRRGGAEGLSPRELRAMARALRMTEGDPEAMLRALRLTVKGNTPSKISDPSWWDRLVSYRAAMMLSGLKTQFVNAVSTAVAMVQVPAEVVMGGLLTGDRRMARMGVDMLAALNPMAEGGIYLNNAWHAAWKSFKELDGQLDPTFVKDEFGFTRLASEGQHMGWFANALSLPSRALLGMDEFMKQLSYQGHIRAQTMDRLRDEAARLGRRHSPEEIGQRIYDDLMASVDDVGFALNPAALEHARTVTFTNQLDYGIGKWLQEGANQHPAIRLIFPFVRTPVNIVRFSAQRFPILGALQRQMREDIAAGGTRRAMALGKQAVGTMAYATAAYWSYQGRLTGAGPSNPQLKSQMLQAGWQPYSVRFGNQWISYQRLEPIATPVALVADFVEAFGELKQDDARGEETVLALGAAMTASMQSKTFLVGATEFFNALSGQPHEFRRFAASMITSFSPAAVRQTNPDPVWREARSLVDEVRASLPGLSATLEPRRNYFGEQVLKPGGYYNRSFNPFTTMSGEGMDDVMLELAELGKAMPMPQTTLSNGRIDLTDREKWVNSDPKRAGQSPYDRMMEIVGELGFRDRLLRRMRSDSWKRMSSGTDAYRGGRKYEIASSMASEYVARARRRMLQEYPDLRNEIRAEDRLRRESLFQISEDN